MGRRLHKQEEPTQAKTSSPRSTRAGIGPGEPWRVYSRLSSQLYATASRPVAGAVQPHLGQRQAAQVVDEPLAVGAEARGAQGTQAHSATSKLASAV